MHNKPWNGEATTFSQYLHDSSRPVIYCLASRYARAIRNNTRQDRSITAMKNDRRMGRYFLSIGPPTAAVAVTTADFTDRFTEQDELCFAIYVKAYVITTILKELDYHKLQKSRHFQLNVGAQGSPFVHVLHTRFEKRSYSVD